jgi:hypothetical protein
MDDKQHIALVETRTQGIDLAPGQLIRFQFGNHLGSASLELIHEAQIISYESTPLMVAGVYQEVRNQAETPRRYRHPGKGRDEEHDLNYQGARFYAHGYLGIADLEISKAVSRVALTRTGLRASSRSTICANPGVSSTEAEGLVRQSSQQLQSAGGRSACQMLQRAHLAAFKSGQTLISAELHTGGGAQGSVPSLYRLRRSGRGAASSSWARRRASPWHGRQHDRRLPVHRPTAGPAPAARPSGTGARVAHAAARGATQVVPGRLKVYSRR